KRGALKAPGQWNHERVTVHGPLLKIEVNGQEVLNTNLDEMAAKFPDHQGVKRRAGHIAFLGHGDRVMFRKVRIAELAPEVNAAAIQAAGYRSLFDGKSLSGWKHSPDTRNWSASHGILKHTGQSGPINDLWTEKSYRNFTLVFDWRWSGRGPLKQQPAVQPDGTENGTVEIEEFDSGVYLRGNTKSQVNLWNWPIGSGEVYGYRTDRSMSAEVRAGVTPKSAEDRPIGEWNRTKITLKDDLLSVELNGVTVINEAQLPGIPADGALGLQHHGSAIDFANLWIKEL
ncbi:MAG: 3-keto-disaccharide hydrolase, partial [Luteolibacter sp.]